ncbi:mimitin, mitochondrial, partial [Paramuricea clavata]
YEEAGGDIRFIRHLVDSVDAVLTNAYVLELLWQEQAAEGDNEIRGHLKNLVSPLFLSILLILADVFSQSAFTSEAAQSDLYPLWDDKANVNKFIGNITKMNEMPVLENPLNRRLRLQYPSIQEGNFTPNFSKPDQQVNILQHDVQFQPRVRHRSQPLTPDDIIRTTEDRLKQLTSEIVREAPIFLAMGEQEENVIKMFDVKSFDYHSSESLREQNNNEFISFAKHLNLSFQVTFHFHDTAAVKSQSDTERFGKLAKDVSEKRSGGKFNETHQDQNKRDRVNQETFIYGNSVPLHSLPLEDLRKEWSKTHLPAILRTNPDKESASKKARREVVTKQKLKHEDYEAGVIPTEWEAWLRGSVDNPPTHEDLLKKQQQQMVLSKRVLEVNRRDKQLQEQEYSDGLVAKPVGHASSATYGHIESSAEPTTSGSQFQPGVWDKQLNTARPGNEDETEKFEPEGWKPP